MLRAKIRKISFFFSAENFQFLFLRNICILYGRVFIMTQRIQKYQTNWMCHGCSLSVYNIGIDIGCKIK